jgi:hypothetical protein
MRHGIRLTTLLIGCGLLCPIAATPARTAQQQKPAAQEPAKKRHRVQGELPFSYDYAKTLALAGKNGKPIFAYFTFET